MLTFFSWVQFVQLEQFAVWTAAQYTHSSFNNIIQYLSTLTLSFRQELESIELKKSLCQKILLMQITKNRRSFIPSFFLPKTAIVNMKTK